MGLVEGVGLMIFQRINWARWGPMMHVSWEIIWISPIVDAILFLSRQWFAALGSVRASPSRDASAHFLLTFLAVYDWLTLTSRLYHRPVSSGFRRRRGFRSLVRKARRRVPAILEKNRSVVVAAWILAFAGIQGGSGCGNEMRWRTFLRLRQVRRTCW